MNPQKTRLALEALADSIVENIRNGNLSDARAMVRKLSGTKGRLVIALVTLLCREDVQSPVWWLRMLREEAGV